MTLTYREIVMAEFGNLDLEEMAGDVARLGDGGENSNFLDQFVQMPDVKPGQTGTVAVRILPPVVGGKLYQYNRVHSINDRKVHCPRPLVNGKWDRTTPCPICDYYSSLWRQIDKLAKTGHVAEADNLKEEARAIKPVERYYFNAIVRSMVVDGETKKNVGPRILSVGKILYTMVLKAIFGEEGDPDSKLGNITDPKAGYDFIIRKEVTPGEGFPKYERSGFARQPSPLGTPEEIGQWQTQLHDLRKLRNPKGIDVLEKELAIHRRLIPDESDTFDAEEFDAKWRSKDDNGEQPVASTTTKSVETAPVVETTKPVVEDVPIEDEEFLKDLEAMSS